MDVAELRYEWRVWGDTTADAATRIAELGTHRETRTSDETYLVSRVTTHVNPKIRDDVLDVKVLRRVVDGFEQWEPQPKRPFPLTSRLVFAELLMPLGVAVPALGRPSYTFPQLIDEVGTDGTIVAVDVTKRRDMYSIGTTTAEVSSVDVAGQTLRTAAIESADLPALRLVRDDVGLGGSGNTSYPKALHHVLRWNSTEEN